MGDFRMKIDAVGGHGCRRDEKVGDELYGCNSQTCPDCMFAAFVQQLRRAGLQVNSATFTHWPEDSPSRGPEIVDSYGPDAVSESQQQYVLMLPKAPGKRVKGSF